MKAALTLCLMLFACGGAPVACPDPEYPNDTPNGLCCDAAWQWCLDADGHRVGAP